MAPSMEYVGTGEEHNLKCMEPEASLWKILPVIKNAKLQVEDLVLINA